MLELINSEAWWAGPEDPWIRRTPPSHTSTATSVPGLLPVLQVSQATSIPSVPSIPEDLLV